MTSWPPMQGGPGFLALDSWERLLQTSETHKQARDMEGGMDNLCDSDT